MKIHIVSDETKIHLRFPTWLLTSRLGIHLFLSQSQKYTKSESEFRLPSSRDLRRLRKVIKDLKKEHGEFPLVEVDSDDGTYVRILL